MKRRPGGHLLDGEVIQHFPQSNNNTEEHYEMTAS
jgi:hypothetical protein